MALRYSLPLVALAVSGLAANVPAFGNQNRGWCYFCSDDGAPPLCNKPCATAIEQLCNEDLTQPWTNAEQDCQIQFFPPALASSADKAGAVTTKDTCVSIFTGILNMCGKDAGDARATYDPGYCTTSGGGGTYGWNDDGSTMTGTGRYRIITKNTNQCGQNKASWKMATSIIQWNDLWVTKDDQVILDTNPPAAAIQDFPEPPAPNPECEKEVCDPYDHPYYARIGTDKQNWVEAPGTITHRLEFSGFAEDERATALSDALTKRCHVKPRKFTPFRREDTFVADISLPSNPKLNLCDCIPDAIYDASAGITLPSKTWCTGAAPNAKPNPGVRPTFESVDNDELRKRERSFGLFNEVPYVPPRLMTLYQRVFTDMTCRKRRR